MPHQIHFHILDQQVRIHVDSAALAEWLSRLYNRFRTPPHSPTLEVTVQTDREGVLAPQSNTAIRLTLPDLTVEQQADIVSKVIYSHVESHLLFHAGAVTRLSTDDLGNNRSQAVMLVGHSGGGKTTLTLELVRRGWGFLSDEVAALGQTSSIIAPFPRAIHLRPRSLSLLGFSSTENTTGEWFDLDQRFPHALSGPGSAHALFLLAGERNDSGQTRLEVTLDNSSPALIAELARIPTITNVSASAQSHHLRLTTQSTDHADLYYQIERVCRSHRCRILDLTVDHNIPADFTDTPSCSLLPPTEAAFALLPHMQSGRRSRIWYGTWQGSPLTLFRTLAQRLSTVHCFRLRPGPLHATADLIERIVGESP